MLSLHAGNCLQTWSQIQVRLLENFQISEIHANFGVFPHSYVATGLLYHDLLNMTLISNETTKLALTFVSPSLVFKWRQCCTDALVCCLNNHRKALELAADKKNINSSQRDKQCPPTWDGWICWDSYAEPETVQEKPCPKHIYWHQLVPPCRGLCVYFWTFSRFWTFL